MKKIFYLICALLIALMFVSCDEETPPDTVDPCTALGGHSMAYVKESETHTYRCMREGCTYSLAAEAHTYTGATCYKPERCSVCGIEGTRYTEHNFAGGTCSRVHRCTECNVKGSEYGDHNFVLISCYERERCSVCGIEGGERYMDHSFAGGTCVAIEVCTVCKVEGTKYGDHSFVSESCLALETCSICGGEGTRYGDHSFAGGSCVALQECTLCGIDGSEYGIHMLSEDGLSCSECGEDYFPLVLEFTLSADGSSYILVGTGYCTAPHVVIPSSYNGLPVTEIGERAFNKNQTIQSVAIPNSIKTIGQYAFYESSLESVVIPDSVENMGKGVFHSCYQLQSATIGAGLTCIEEDTFCYTGLKRITIPGNIERIKIWAFEGCMALEEVIIENGVKHIEQEAFYYSPSLKTISFPDSIQSIAADVFGECTSIEYNVYEGMKYLGNEEKPYLILFGSAGGDRVVAHEDTILYMIGALKNCENVVSVTVGPNVKYIGEDALKGMDALVELKVDEANEFYYSINNLLIDRETNQILRACTASVIPSDGTFVSIDLDIFSDLATLEVIYIPKGVKTVYIEFQNLTGLKSVIIESDVEAVVIGGNDANEDFAVYYCRTALEWNRNIESDMFEDGYYAGIGLVDHYSKVEKYLYSEAEPTAEGNYWHWVDGEPVIWD